jgi:hypothetical protein
VSCFSSRASTRQRPYLPVSHLKNAGTPISNGLSIVRVRPSSSARRTFRSSSQRAPRSGLNYRVCPCSTQTGRSIQRK